MVYHPQKLEVTQGGTGDITLTNHGLLIGQGSSPIAATSAGTALQVMQSGGASVDPTWSNFTILANFAQGDIPFANTANTLTGLAKNTNASRYIANTGTTNNPAWDQVDLSNGVKNTLQIAFGGTGYGGSPVGGGIFYSGTVAGGLSIASTSPGQVLTSQNVGGGVFAPIWTTSTFPSTVPINDLLYASAANVISGLATANNGILITSGTGVPSISSTLPTAVQDNITRLGTIASIGAPLGAAFGGTGVVNNAANTLTWSGVFGATFTLTGTTSVTFPTSGTLATTAGSVASITGTANQIAASSPTGAVTLSLIGPYTPATYTAHGVLVGEGTSSIVSVATSATVGVPLISQGASADPIFGTALVAGGGTGVTSVTIAPTATAFAGWDSNANLSADAFIAGYLSTATSGATTTLTVNSKQQQYFTGSSTQTVTMPVTSTLVLGQSYTIVNLSSGTVTVQSSGGNTIQALVQNSQSILTVVDTTLTTASAWNNIYSVTAGVTSITGTANQISASASVGSITLSIPSTFIAPGSMSCVTGFTACTSSGVATIGSSTQLTISAAGLLTVANATDSSSGSTGSINTLGGIGSTKSIFCGGNLLLPTSTASVGVIRINSVNYFHNGGVATSVFIGNSGNFTSSGSTNISIGNGASVALTSGANTTVIGGGAGALITSGNNHCLYGLQAGSKITTTDNSCAFGLQALQFNTAAANCAFGVNSLAGSNGASTGGNNCAFGISSGLVVTTAANCVFIGASSGVATTTGGNNVYIGFSAGSVATTSTDNVCVGNLAGSAITLVGAGGTVAIGSECFVTLANSGGATAVGYQAGKFTTGGSNTYIGQQAGMGVSSNTHNNNTAVGYQALKNATTASGTVSIGHQSHLNLSTATDAVAIGRLSGAQTTTGIENVYIGVGAGQFNATGTKNTACGAYALDGVTGNNNSNNTAFGWAALTGITTGGSNCAFGVNSCAAISSASTNTAYGFQTINGGTTTFGNTAIGYNSMGSGVVFTSGANTNIAIGYNSGASWGGTTEVNNICIGPLGVSGDTNTTRIGYVNAAGTTGTITACYIDGINGVTAGGTAVTCATTGRLGNIISSRRYKDNIEDLLPEESEFIMKFRPRKFIYKDSPHMKTRYGLIAEEVNEISDYLVVRHHETNEIESVQYHELPVLLLNEIQKMSKRISDLETQIKGLLP